MTSSHPWRTDSGCRPHWRFRLHGCLAFWIAIGAFGSHGNAQVLLSPSQASNRTDETVTVCGKIGAAHGLDRDGRKWLEFQSQTETTIRVVMPSTGDDTALYENRAACVTAKVLAGPVHPEMHLTSAVQLLLFDAVPEVVDRLPIMTEAASQPPTVLHSVEPKYDRAKSKSGRVVMESVVLANGQVGDIRILESLDPALGLDQAAVLALKQWRFVPAKVGGRAIPSVVRVEVPFYR